MSIPSLSGILSNIEETMFSFTFVSYINLLNSRLCYIITQGEAEASQEQQAEETPAAEEKPADEQAPAAEGWPLTPE